jgi:trans-aconitate 2-methyltransferase
LAQPVKYEWNAEEYAKHSATQLEWAKELIPKLKLSGNENLLDIGCGDGKITAQIATCLPDGTVVGVDNSEDMIRLAQRSFPDNEYPNLSFQRRDARKLDFDEQFDLVFSNAALHWIVDHRPVLEGVKCSLKPMGRLLFQMGGKGNAHNVLAIIEDLKAEARWGQYFADFTFPYGFYAPEEYAVWLREAGLKPGRVELLAKDMKQAGKDGLAGWIRTTWLPYTDQLPAKLRGEFIAEIVDRYVNKHPPDEAGFVHVAMVRLEVEASKP